MNQLPRDLWPDATLPLFRDPYRYISRKARRFGTDAFRTRFLGQESCCMTGAQAAEFFYTPGHFTRTGSLPERIGFVLFGPGGVQRLDGAAHHHRKALFLDLMSEESLARLDACFDQAWTAALPRLESLEQLDVLTETARILTTATGDWTGVHIPDRNLDEVSEMLSALFLHAGAVGRKHRHGERMRHRAQDWAKSLIKHARHDRAAGRRDIVSAVAGWTDADGNPLSNDVAATELLNVLRPTVAVSVFATHLVIALGRDAGYRSGIPGDPQLRSAFVQEVRRLYPFFPAVGAVTTEELTWRGQAIPEGTRVLLDLYGTCRDPAAWEHPESFLPERFLGWQGDPWTMIPQGGGEHAITHRCPGEWATIRLMESFAERFATARYDVLTPDASPDMRAIPALPRGGMVLTNFRG